jgi:hypothetical protein
VRQQIWLALLAVIVVLSFAGYAASQDLNGTYAATLAADDVKIPDGAQIPPDAMVGTRVSRQGGWRHAHFHEDTR